MIKEIVVEKEALNYSYTKELLSINDGIRIKILEKREKGFRADREWGIAKRRLLARVYKGKWLKKCPGTRGLLCCNYYVINPVINCPYNCTYCFLQGYIDSPYTQVMVNIEDMFEELEDEFRLLGDGKIRIGTGEMADSLALDDYLKLNKKLIDFFRKFPNAILELKTKSDNVDHLLMIDAPRNVVISWTISPEVITLNEELGTASLTERIKAIRKVISAGYRVGIHFDPIIYYPGWEKGYRDAVERVFTILPEGQIAWVSMGSLRFFPYHLDEARRRFPTHRILFEEMIKGADGKFRYPKPVRVEMYRKILTWIRSIRPGAFVYLCMEGRDMWRQVFGFAPDSDVKVGELFFRYSGAFAK